MARSDERSVADLQKESERSRSELAQTVDQLRSKVAETVADVRERASPDAVKAEIGEYVRKRADALLDKARENPLQTAAIGIGVAYPLLTIVRSIPAPVLMVGAGVFLLGSSSGQKLTADVSRRAAAAGESVSVSLGAAGDAATKKVHDTRDLTSSTLASMQDTLASGVAGAKHHAASVGASLDPLQDAASGVVSFASDGLADLKHRTVDAVGAAANSLAAGVTEASSNFRNGASSAGESGTETVLAFRDRALETSQKVSSGVSAIIQENPLLVGGLGLAIGMLIASALPRSDFENNIMGGPSAHVQRRANEFASKEFDAVKGLASAAIAEITDHASEKGLLPADLNAAAENLGERVRKVAESATDAVLGQANEKTIDAA
jgi:ElaB/YqjD/DUF883 family membrane-anchored ribosome-binding protein